MQKMLIAVAENGSLDENLYSLIRREFMNSNAKSLLPEIIKTCPSQYNLTIERSQNMELISYDSMNG